MIDQTGSHAVARLVHLTFAREVHGSCVVFTGQTYPTHPHYPTHPPYLTDPPY